MDKTAGVVMFFSDSDNIHITTIDKLAISVIKDTESAKNFINAVAPIISGTLLKANYTTSETVDIS